MKKQPFPFRLMIAFLLIGILCFTGCYYFDFVNQPFSAEPGSSFEVEISVTIGPETGGNGIPYFGILLPLGWTVNDSIVFHYENTFGMLVYSDSLTQAMYGIEPVPLFYHWWVARGLGEIQFSTGWTYQFSPRINTVYQTGMYYLDYMVGDDQNGLNYKRSNDHLITVGLPESVTVANSNDNGPGSLRNAIDAVDFYGTIYFDLDTGDTIILEDQLNIYKDLKIIAPQENPVVISGNNQQRVFNITEGRSPMLSNLHIVQGKADFGGGIYCIGSSVTLKNVTLTGNSSEERGGGIYGTAIFFDSVQRSNIYQNDAIWGNDIYSETPVELFLDTFTVMYPTEYHLFPRENFICDIFYGKFQQVDADLFVSPEGDDSNSGLTAGDPLQTLDHAYRIIRADSLHQHVIHLLNGTYSPSSNNEKFPVNLPDFIGLSGESVNGVILDAEEQSDALLIDNNAATSCVYLTIKRGNMGINSTNSNLVMSNATVTNNQNNGIYFTGGLLDLENVKITNNTATGYQSRGGGIHCIGATAVLRNIEISYNTCNYTGGGIYFEDVSSVFENVTISHNTALYGGGISCHRSAFDFDSTNRCNIYLNYAEYGNDLELNSYANVILDTFTVLYPTEFHALGDIDFDILHGKIEQADCDLYVSPEGDDNNSGLSPEDPLKTIWFAESRIRADAAHHHTIQLLNGTYGPSTNGEEMPIQVLAYFNINGTSAGEVILDAAGLSGVMEIESEAGTKISNLTVTGGNAEYGGGIYCYGAPVIENVIITSNIADHGAGIRLGGDGALLQSVLIYDNSASDRGGGIYCSKCSATLQNITVSNNEGARGGGLFCENGTSMIIKNSIFSGNTGEVCFLNFNPANYVYSYYSDYYGWIDAGNGAIYWLGINTFQDPLFSGAGDHPYSLSDISPCIDAGTNSTGYMPDGDLLGNQRLWDGDGNGSAIVDMGAYEYGSIPVGMQDSEFRPPACGPGSGFRIELYPNPADGIVNCQLSVVDFQRITVKIVDLFGREIGTMMDEVKSPGEYAVWMEVSNLPAGVYLVRLQVGGQDAVKKLVVR